MKKWVNRETYQNPIQNIKNGDMSWELFLPVTKTFKWKINFDFKVAYMHSLKDYHNNSGIIFGFPCVLMLKLIAYTCTYNTPTICEASKPFLNPSNAGATLVRSTRTQRFLKTTLTLPCWYSLDSVHWVLSGDYSCAWVSVIFRCSAFCIGQINLQPHKD